MVNNKILTLYQFSGATVINTLDLDLSNGSALDNALSFDLEVTTSENLTSGGATSYPVDIAATQLSRNYFNDWQNEANEKGTETNDRNFVLSLNAVPVRSGRARLVSANKSKIKLNLFLDNQELWTAIANTKVNELFSVDDWNLDYDDAALSYTITGAGLLSGSQDWAYLPVKARTWSQVSSQAVIAPKDYWLSVRAKKVIDLVCARVTPLASYSSSFAALPIYKDVCFLVNTARPYERATANSLYSLRASSTAAFSLVCQPPVPTPTTWTDFEEITDDSTGINFDNGGMYDPSTWTFTAPIKSEYNFKFHFEYSVPIPSGTKLILLLRPLINGTPTTSYGGGLLQTEFSLPPLQLEAGDEVFMQYMLFDFDLTPPFPTSVDFETVQMTVELGEKQIGGKLLLPAQIPASWTVADFLAGYFGMFNIRCFFNTDTRVLHFEPARGVGGVTPFYGREIDWSGRVDMLNATATPASERLDFTLTYSSSDDGTVEFWDKTLATKVAAAQFKASDVNNAKANTLELPCAKINHIIDSTLVNVDEQTPPQLPLIYSAIHNEEAFGIDFNQTDKLYFVIAASPFDTLARTVDSTGTVTFEPQMQAFQIYLQNAALAMTGGNAYRGVSLLFGDYYRPDSSLICGLMRNFYLAELDNLATAKRYSASVRIDLTDFLTYDPRALVRIDGQVYEMEQLTYKPDSGNNEAVLRTFLAPRQNAQLQIISSPQQPIVIYG